MSPEDENKQFEESKKYEESRSGSYRYKRKEKSRPASKTVPVSDLLAVVSQQLGLNEKVKELAVYSLWRGLVPPKYADKTQPNRIIRAHGKTVFKVKVNDPALAAEMSFFVEDYRQKLNGFAPQTGIFIDKIELSVGHF